MSTKGSNPFQSNGWNYFDKLAVGESSYMPHFYENDMTPSFRSPKIYTTQQQPDYFTTARTDELDDCDDLYEATLMNSHFLQSLDTKKPATATPVKRLLQILNHVNPTYHTPSPLSEALSSSTPSSSSSSSSQQAPTMPDPQ